MEKILSSIRMQASSSGRETRSLVKGVLLVAALASTAIAASQLSSLQKLGLGPLTFAIIFGIAAGNTVFPRISTATSHGVDFSKNRLLRIGVMLYGFRITVGELLGIGLHGAVIDATMIAATYSLAVFLGTRVFKLDRETSMLIGTGSAICGAAAILAAEPVVQARAHQVGVAVATVVVFGTVAMFFYPIVYPWLGLSPRAYGIFAGSTIHEVAQVVAAGRAVGGPAAEAAVIEKMLRVIMLAPFLLLLSRNLQRKRKASCQSTQAAPGGIVVPWFAFVFVAACALNSLNVVPARTVQYLLQLDSLLLAMAMAALGLRTQVSAIRAAGARPLMLAASLFAFLTVGGYGINRLIGG